MHMRTTLLTASLIGLSLSLGNVSAEARGWKWFVTHIKSGPHCNGEPTTMYGEGRHNADGSRFNPHGLSAAHWRYPFGTVLRVTNCNNGKSVDVVVKDRGPGRHQVALGINLDLSYGAAKAIQLGQNGRFESGYTSYTVVSLGDGKMERSNSKRRHKYRDKTNIQVASRYPTSNCTGCN